MRLSGEHVFELRTVGQIRHRNPGVLPGLRAQWQRCRLAVQQARKKPTRNGQDASALVLALERQDMRRLRAAALECGIGAIAEQQCKLLPEREQAPAEPELGLAVMRRTGEVGN